MDNNRKLTIEEFDNIKKEMQRIYREAENVERNRSNDANFNEQEFLRQFFNEYLPLQNLLLSSDLSDIPFEEYRDLLFIPVDENDILDFSKTKANIDFNILKLDGNNFNFKNCTIRNLESFYGLKEEYFDDKTISENQDIFLSSDFSSNFKEKYYNMTLSIEDFTNLTDSQLEEVSRKGIRKYQANGINHEYFDRSSNKGVNIIINILGLEKTVKLYKESSNNCQDLVNLLGLNRNLSFDLNGYKISLDNIELKDIKNTIYNYLRDEIINTYITINPKQFTENFIKENNDIFLIGINIPDKLRELCYNRQLTYKDIVNNLDVFKQFDYRIFICVADRETKMFANKIGLDNFNYIIKEHRDVFEHFYYEHMLGRFSDYLNSEMDLESDLSIALQKYIHECENGILKEKTNEDGKKTYYLPNWTKSMNYKLVDHYDRFEDILNYTNETFLINKNQFNAINTLKLKNILKLDKETGIFSSNSDNFINFLEAIGANPTGITFRVLEEIKSNLKCNMKEEVLIANVFNVFLSNDNQWGFLSNIYNDIDVDEANKKRINIYNNLKWCDNEVIYMVKSYINANNLGEKEVESLINIARKIASSNSSELRNHANAMFKEIMNSDNPEENFKKIENVFIKNNLPTVGKVFLTFETLHPDLNGFNFRDVSMVSPILKSKSTRGREAIIFSDLIKSAIGSNNRSMREYIYNLKNGSYLFNELASDNISFKDLNDTQQVLLNVFMSHLDTLYYNTIKGKNNTYNQYVNLNEKINFYINNLNINDKENIGDRLVSMFCHFAGFDSVESLEKAMDNSVNKADIRNRERVKENQQILESGDFIKGIGDIRYLTNILQNGSVAKEYLGANADSDCTPLDTDVTKVNQSIRISDTISSSYSGSWGPIWLVLKNDDRFIMTRDESGEHIPSNNIKDIMNKLEAFSTGAGENTYGIRTGFASSNIDYIITANNDNRIGVEIAKNGFYIPVVDKETEKVIFTPDDYDNLRSKMQGLSYYGTSEYQVPNNLESDEINDLTNALEQSKEENKRNREAINETLRYALNTVNLSLKNTVDKKLETGTVELIDTGSTGRDTNLPGDGDYDFIMRLDREIISDPGKLENVKEALIKQLGIEHKKEILNGNFRFKNVNIKGVNKPIDIDITFIPKTDKLEYSSDEALKDRFNSIREQSSDKYNLVLANVIEAKKTLKEAEVYKKQQGGISGIGIENWVLQNGGSFHDAATSFIEASKDKTVEEFKNSYAIWDFGENHYADEKGIYKHDNFIDNLTEDGYKKMKQTLTMYLLKEKQKEDLKDILSLDDESKKNFTSSTTMSY